MILSTAEVDPRRGGADQLEGEEGEVQVEIVILHLYNSNLFARVKTSA